MNDTTPIVALLEKIEHHMDKLVSFMSKGTGMMAGEVVSMPTRAVSGFSPGMRNAVIGKSGPVQGAAADLRRDPREPIAFPVAKTFRTRFRPESLPRPIESARGEDRPIIKNIVKIASPVRGENAG